MKNKEEKHPDKENSKQSEIQKESDSKLKEKEYEALLDKYVRLQAEFDNYKKRSYREKIEFVKFANEGLILELVGILDNFELGIKSAERKKDFNLLHQGVDMISKQLHSLLEAKGLVRIKSSGEKFDPHRHEALEVVDDDTVEADTVLEELQPGYVLNDRILRPAKVKVARKKTKDDTDQDKDQDENQKEE